MVMVSYFFGLWGRERQSVCVHVFVSECLSVCLCKGNCVAGTLNVCICLCLCMFIHMCLDVSVVACMCVCVCMGLCNCDCLVSKMKLSSHYMRLCLCVCDYTGVLVCVYMTSQVCWYVCIWLHRCVGMCVTRRSPRTTAGQCVLDACWWRPGTGWDRQADRWMDGQTDTQADRWMDRQIHRTGR